MKNKNLLTSFLPMLVTAALLIVAPMAREAFYSATSSGKNLSFNLPKGFEASPRLSADNAERSETKTELKYTGDQFPAHYKNGKFKVLNNRIYFESTQTERSTKMAIFASDLPSASGTSSQLTLSQGADGSIDLNCGAGGAVYRITYKK